MENEEELKIWMDYVITQSELNNIKPLLTVYDNRAYPIKYINFPVLKVYWGITHKIKILLFNEFKNTLLPKWKTLMQNREYCKSNSS